MRSAPDSLDVMRGIYRRAAIFFLVVYVCLSVLPASGVLHPQGVADPQGGGDALAPNDETLAVPLPPAQQPAPRTFFDLDAAAAGVSKIETTLDSFERTVYDVTGAEPRNHAFEGEVRRFLKQAREILRTSEETLCLSLRQLQAALLVDPSHMEQRTEVRRRIEMTLFRLRKLSEKIDNHLASRE